MSEINKKWQFARLQLPYGNHLATFATAELDLCQLDNLEYVIALKTGFEKDMRVEVVDTDFLHAGEFYGIQLQRSFTRIVSEPFLKQQLHSSMARSLIEVDMMHACIYNEEHSPFRSAISAL